MKNIFKLGLLSMLSLSVVSCNVEEISDYSALADVAFLTSVSTNYNSHEYIYIATKKHISIMDASQGTLSHKWVVPEGVGIHLLKGDPIDEASSDIVWSDYIDPTIPYTNDLSTLHMYFDEYAATYDGEPIVVNLVNTYDKPVTYNYLMNHEGSTAASIESVEVNGVHVLTIPFTIQVYDSTMVPAAEYYTDAAMTQKLETYETETTNATTGVVTVTNWVDVTVGQTIYFKDISTDRPNVWAWSVTPPTTANKVSYTTQDISYTFNESGTSTVSFGVQRAAEGYDYYSKNIPTGSMKTTNSIVKVKVVDAAPTNPVIKSVEYNPATTNIEIAVDGAMFDATSLTGNADLFTITYKNTTDSSKTGTLSASSVSLKYDDGGTSDDDTDDTPIYNTIVIVPSESVYTDDEITITYDDSIGTDGVRYVGGDAASGTQVAFTMPEEGSAVTIMNKVLFSYDFEDEELGSSAGWIIRKIDSSNSDGEVYDSKPEVYTNPDYGTSTVNSSSKCLYLNLNKARRTSGYSTAFLTDDDYTRVFTPIEDAGVPYRVRFKYRYDEGATSAYTISAQISVYSAWKLTDAASYGKELVTTEGYVYTTSENTWIQHDQTITMSGTIPTSDHYPDWAPYMTFTEGWNCRLYIDDFSAEIYNPRP